MVAAVVDTSVAAKWVVNEPDGNRAAILLDYDALYAPSHWQAEAVSVLSSKVIRGELTPEAAQPRLAALMRATVIETATATLIPDAFNLAVTYSVTVYDALYVALAIKKGVPLVTADEKLIRRLRGRTAATLQSVSTL